MKNRDVRKTNFALMAGDIIAQGVDLGRHYRENKGIARFGELSYEEKLAKFNDNIFKEVERVSGIETGGMTSVDALRTFTTYREAYFAILSTIVDRVYPKTDVAEILQMAEVRSGAEGDSQTFNIPSKNLIKINKGARGVRDTDYTRLYNEDVHLSPEPRRGGVKIDLYSMAVGTYDFGQFINRVGLSFVNKMNTEANETIWNSYATLGTNFKESAYAEDSFQTLAERVSASNGSQAYAIGSKIALNKIDPTNDYYKMGLGAEKASQGYLSSVAGVPAMPLMQSVDPNSSMEFVIPNNKILLASPATDKLVKIFMEGQTRIVQSFSGQYADDVMSYVMEQAWDMAIATSSNYGIIEW